MAIIKKNFVLFFIALLGFGLGHEARSADNAYYSDNEFIASLQAQFRNVPARQLMQVQPVLDTFAILYNSGTLTEGQKSQIHSTVETFPAMRLRPVPDVILYLQGVISVLKTHHAEDNFDTWHRSFRENLNLRGQRQVLDNWQRSLPLFEHNVVHSRASLAWKLTVPNYTLAYENNTLKVVFPLGNIICISHNDSLIIYNTQGFVNLLENRLYGTGGKITWERVLLDPNRVYAQLDEFVIDLSVARFEADSVRFFNLDLFSFPINGRVSDRIISDVRPESATFPRFESYSLIHEINNLFPGINYRGGFTMSGQRLLGTGTAEGNATLKFYRSDSLYVAINGQLFNILSDRIIAEKAAVSIYLMGDSIHHPSLDVRFMQQTRELSLQRGTNGVLSPPFFNSFHMIDMFSESIVWNIDKNAMEIKMLLGMRTEGTAVFESRDYFSDVLYMRLQGLSGLHPLIQLRNFSNQIKSRTFPIAEYARFIRTDVANVRSQLVTFAHHGFLTYNQEQQIVTLKDKVFHYVGAYVGNNDFDALRIESVAPVNAILNMNNFDLHVKGVEKIPLSDARNVVIHPNNHEVIMKKNRDMSFHGRIESGLFDFFGKEFHFDYGRFKINLVNTDSMSFRVRSFEPDSRGEYSEVRVRTVLEGINGELIIDRPNNKSGRLQVQGYPVFNSNNESFVYYDREFVQSGVYRRENFYFRIIPFSIDSLDMATTDNILFDGVFISTGIFPDFYDYLTVQRDYSLGFNTHTPPEGFPIYDGRALYKGPINLSYEGLRTDGQLIYLNADIQVNQMYMFPDSARALVRSFDLASQVQPIEYPQIGARDLNMHFLPYENRMTLNSTTHPMRFYDGIAQKAGQIELTPQGVSGNGRMSFYNSELTSNSFDYNRLSFTASEADLRIKNEDGDALIVEANDYNTFVDFASKSTTLDALGPNSQVNFHPNRFRSNGYDIAWDMENRHLRMENLRHDEIAALGSLTPKEWIDMDFGAHGLVSTNPQQEGLNLFAGTIDYDLDENIIHAQDVKIIEIADAAIFPTNEEVFLEPTGALRRLENSLIVANTETLLHQFHNASISIISQNRFTGTGTYDFTNYRGDIQQVYFESISVDRNTNSTVAIAKIGKENEFTISPYFRYFGELNLRVENPNFLYDGAAQIVVDCGLYPNWFRFTSELYLDSIYIPIIDDLRNEEGGRVSSALMLAGDTVRIYPAFLGRQTHHSDLAIISAMGLLTFDKSANEYVITTPERFADSTLAHDIIRLNPSTCMLIGEGKIALSSGLGQFGVNTSGKVSHDIVNKNTTLDVVMGINFHFANHPSDHLKKAFQTRTDLDTLSLDSLKVATYLQQKAGRETTLRVMNQLTPEGTFSRIPEELNHRLFLADLRLRWDQDRKTFHSTHPIGIGNIENAPIFRYTPGFLEIAKNRAGDVFNMILIPSGLADEGVGRDWYFFHYTNNIMETISSDQNFNDMIRDINPNRRRMEVAPGQPPFIFTLASDRSPFDFVRIMRELTP